jgi:hypothetical protein
LGWRAKEDELMTSVARVRGRKRATAVVALYIAALMGSGSALAGGPVLGGPSVLRVADQARMTGANFPANTSVTVFVTAPDGAKAGFGKMVDGDGSLSYSFVGARPGAYVVTVADSGGRVLATTRVHFAQ